VLPSSRHLLILTLASLLALPTARTSAAERGADDPAVIIWDDAELQTSAVDGTVVDTSGGAIASATVILALPTGPERQTRTDAAGRFVFAGVPEGPGTVTVVFDRFSPMTVDLESARTGLEVVLSPLPLSEQVTVHAPRLTVPRVTTATRTDTLLRDVPQAISVVTRALIADQRMQGIGDVVRYVPGVGMAQGEGNRDTPIFRGNSSTSDFYVDGVRDDTQYFRDLYNVERVEALKGPNARIFGRGGVGGVINRVGRQADWATSREVSVDAGTAGGRRLSGDVGQGINGKVALRLTGMFEDSDSYRDGVTLERYGLNPTLAVALGPNTTLRASYEHFHDDRTADRGISSYNGRPVDTDPSTFFGNAALSDSTATVDTVSALFEHRINARLTVRNRASVATYDKFYQNVFPGAVNAAGTTVSLSGYNNATDRTNLFNQTDFILTSRTGRIDHTVLAGVEVGRQETDNFRNTGYFTTLGPNVTTVLAPLSNPVTTLPMAWRQGATDADNHGVATTAAAYVQDQVALSSQVQAVVGVRVDQFNMDFTNNRTAVALTSRDTLASPRVGLIYRPQEPVSVYGSYTLSYLPRAGEQLSSLSLTNQALDPEEFRNYELGAKWDVLPALAFTAAVYNLDRSNVAVPDPLDPTRSILVDAQRSRGVELELSGNPTDRWSVAGGYAFQDGTITQSISATVPAGSTLAQLPDHSISFWNKYDISRRWGVGLGILYRSDMFAATDNTVVLPAYTRVDAAGFFTLSPRFRAQLNIENLFDANYYPNAHSNTNITPGAPIAARLSLTTRF